ncbi:unnamed protein product, partial [Ectocarpus fasciculatus]
RGCTGRARSSGLSFGCILADHSPTRTTTRTRVRAASTKSGIRLAGFTIRQWRWCTWRWRGCSGDIQV